MLKKILMLIIAAALVMVFLSSVGPLVALVLSVAVLYFAARQFLKSDSIGGKIFWAILGLIGLSASLSNLPAIIGLLALYILYLGYKKWKQEEDGGMDIDNNVGDDPFTNFERQWKELKQDQM